MAGQSTNRLAFPYFPKGCKIWLTGSRNTPARMSAWNLPYLPCRLLLETSAGSNRQLRHQIRQISRMQGTLPQNQGSSRAQERDHRCVPNAPDHYLERPVQTGALFCKGLSHRQIAEHSVVISKAQGLELLRKRGYIFTDEVNIPAVT